MSLEYLGSIYTVSVTPYWNIVEQFKTLKGGLGGICKNYIFPPDPLTSADSESITILLIIKLLQIKVRNITHCEGLSVCDAPPMPDSQDCPQI